MKSENQTIYDIAEAAGVSITTVSRVLRGEKNVSEKTRQRVDDAISRFNYRPSAIARSMTGKKTNTLGIILPKLLNPNYAMIFTGAYDEARRHGYTMSLFPMRSLYADDFNPALMLAERRLDGVILYMEYLAPELHEKVLSSVQELRHYMPVITIGCMQEGFGDYPSISYNMKSIAREAVKYLVGLGHERIALIGGSEMDVDESRRDTGYTEGLQEAKLPFVSSYRVFCGGTAEDGEAAMEGVFTSLMPSFWPTAVIALNDPVAMGCQKAARKRNLRLPQDLSVIGCDDLFCSPYLQPPLTTFNMHQQRLGARAVALLLSGENRHEDADWEMVLRESCAHISKGEKSK